jgi:tetratricopeptide (TPR) repeat protein
VLGPSHPITLAARNNLAQIYCDEGRYAEAETLDIETLDSRKRALGPDNPETLMSMGNLAGDYSFRGKFTLAETLFGQTLAIERRVMGIESRFTIGTLSDRASMYQREGKYALAVADAAQALAAWRRSLGEDSPVTMQAAADLALAYLSEGTFIESEALAREAFEFDQRKQPDNWQRFRAESLLGASLAGQKRFIEAEPMLLEGYQGMLMRKDRMAVPDRYHLDRAHEWLVQLYRAWGRPEKASEWKRE